jgi:hypothetical protein
MFSHKENVETPSLQAIYSAGDIIGNRDIDLGWSCDTHSWIISYEPCDILLLRKEYVDYLWDKMKKSDLTMEMANRLKESESFKGISEQTIYTIAADILQFKQSKKGELMVS